MTDETAKQFLETVEASIETLRYVRKALKSGGAYHNTVDHEVRQDLGYVKNDLEKLLNPSPPPL